MEIGISRCSTNRLFAFHFGSTGPRNFQIFSKASAGYSSSGSRVVYLESAFVHSFRRKPVRSYFLRGGFKGQVSLGDRLTSSMAGSDTVSRCSIKRYEEGPLFHHLVTYNDVAYLAGQVASDTSDQTVRGQAQQIFSRIDQLLEMAGTDKSRLLSANVWLKNIEHVAEFNQVWSAWVDPSSKPVRATVEAKLVRPELLVEVQVTAALPRKITPLKTDLAAAAVGPYHQGVLLENGMIYVSGCIGEFYCCSFCIYFYGLHM